MEMPEWAVLHLLAGGTNPETGAPHNDEMLSRSYVIKALRAGSEALIAMKAATNPVVGAGAGGAPSSGAAPKRRGRPRKIDRIAVETPDPIERSLPASAPLAGEGMPPASDDFLYEEPPSCS